MVWHFHAVSSEVGVRKDSTRTRRVGVGLLETEDASLC